MTACGATVRARGPANDHTHSAGERQSAAGSPEPSATERAAAGGDRVSRPATGAAGRGSGGTADWNRPAGPTDATPDCGLQPAGPTAVRTQAIVKWRGRVVARRSCKLVQL